MRKLLKFSTPTCMNCRFLSEIIKQVDLGDVELVELNALEHKDLTEKYKFRSVPTLVLLDEDGNEINKHIGILNAEQIKEFISKGE